jgi:hypothetical protein
MDTKQRLLDALQAISLARPAVNYETAFNFLAQYVPGSNGAVDEELQDAFRVADGAIRRGKGG